MPSSLRKTRAGSAVDLASAATARVQAAAQRLASPRRSSRTAAPVAPATRTAPVAGADQLRRLLGTHTSVLAFPGAAGRRDWRAKPARDDARRVVSIDRRRFVVIAVFERRRGRVQHVARSEGPLALVRSAASRTGGPPVHRARSVWSGLSCCSCASRSQTLQRRSMLAWCSQKIGSSAAVDRHRHQPEIAPVVGIPTWRDATDRAMDDVVRQDFEAAVGGLRLGPVMEQRLRAAEPGRNIAVAAGEHVVLERRQRHERRIELRWASCRRRSGARPAADCPIRREASRRRTRQAACARWAGSRRCSSNTAAPSLRARRRSRRRRERSLRMPPDTRDAREGSTSSGAGIGSRNGAGRRAVGERRVRLESRRTLARRPDASRASPPGTTSSSGRSTAVDCSVRTALAYHRSVSFHPAPKPHTSLRTRAMQSSLLQMRPPLSDGELDRP